MRCYFVRPEDRPVDPRDDDSSYALPSLSPDLLARHGARVLDPVAVPVADGWPVPQPTVYRTRTFLSRPGCSGSRTSGSSNRCSRRWACALPG